MIKTLQGGAITQTVIGGQTVYNNNNNTQICKVPDAKLQRR